MRAQPLIAVRDVEASSRWYQTLLGLDSAHGGPDYERLEIDGVLLWFEVDDFDAAVARAGTLHADVVLAPHRNPPEGEPGGPAHREIWLHDLDGYAVVLASPDGESPLT